MAQSLKIFCLVNGESTSRAFSLSIPTTADIDDLKDLIKSKKTPEFDDIAADKFTVWKVSIAVIAASKHDVITLGSLKIKEELLPTDELSDVFGKEPLPRQTIHIIVQRLSAAGNEQATPWFTLLIQSLIQALMKVSCTACWCTAILCTDFFCDNSLL
ncbi:hypothetical protein BGZ58_005809 [Dissophora ornata]|nr:hypothetical protein BGZ58_005809 [Dissophora ornata]